MNSPGIHRAVGYAVGIGARAQSTFVRKGDRDVFAC
jgi:hypothetical protein